MKKQKPSNSDKSKRRLWLRVAIIALAAGSLLGLSSCYHHHGYHGYGGYHGGGHHGSYYGGGGGGYCY